MNKKAFTIIELMTVMGVLAILMSITLIAVNPTRQFKLANNGKRQSDIVEILNAINAYSSNNLGDVTVLGKISTTAKEIGSGAGKVDICAILIPKYVASLPIDTPSANPITEANCSNYAIGYGVCLSKCDGGPQTDNRVTVYSLKFDQLNLTPIPTGMTR